MLARATLDSPGGRINELRRFLPALSALAGARQKEKANALDVPIIRCSRPEAFGDKRHPLGQRPGWDRNVPVRPGDTLGIPICATAPRMRPFAVPSAL